MQLGEAQNEVASQHPNLKLVAVVGFIELLSIPIVFLFLAAGGIVQSDVGHSVPHLRVMMRLEEQLILLLFLCGSSAWAVYKYGLYKAAWIVLVLPLILISFIVVEQIAYDRHFGQCVGNHAANLSVIKLERYCEDKSTGIAVTKFTW